jgi:hypothetical protein
VTVTAEEWAAAAADHGMSVDVMRSKIADVDNSAGERLAAHYHLDPLHFDRDGEPITFAEWAYLFESPSYKFVAATVLPNRYWIATIWQGINEDLDDPPIVLETSVFRLSPEQTELPPHTERVVHASLPHAREVHAELVDRFARS